MKHYSQLHKLPSRYSMQIKNQNKPKNFLEKINFKEIKMLDLTIRHNQRSRNECVHISIPNPGKHPQGAGSKGEKLKISGHEDDTY